MGVVNYNNKFSELTEKQALAVCKSGIANMLAKTGKGLYHCVETSALCSHAMPYDKNMAFFAVETALVEDLYACLDRNGRAVWGKLNNLVCRRLREIAKLQGFARELTGKRDEEYRQTWRQFGGYLLSK